MIEDVRQNAVELGAVLARYLQYLLYISTVKPVLSGHSKQDKTKMLMTNSSLMDVESIAECSPWGNLHPDSAILL